MSKDWLAITFIVIGVVIIPLVHFIAPMFYSATPNYVATGEGSIIGQTNVAAQLAPFVLAYISAPILVVWGSVRLMKSRRC
jgi:hypothetical protein